MTPWVRVCQTGENALIKAAMWGHLDAVQTLLSLGLDPNYVKEVRLKIRLQHPPHAAAAVLLCGTHNVAVKMMQPERSDPAAACPGQRWLAGRTPPVCAVPVQSDGKTALRMATDKGFLPVVQELVSAGAIIDYTDKVCSSTTSC